MKTSSATAEIDNGPHGASTLSLSSTIYFTFVIAHFMPCLYSNIISRVLMRVQTIATYSPNFNILKNDQPTNQLTNQPTDRPTGDAYIVL